MQIVSHYEKCLETHGDTFKGVDWPNEVDAATRYRVMLGVIKDDANVTLLDFGCGAGHLLEYVKRNKQYKGVSITGADISEKYINLCKQKFPETTFLQFDILDINLETLQNYDYVVMNGVFTEKQDLSFEDMFAYFKLVLERIFKKVEKGLAFNVMSKAVDWERDDLFHLSTDLLIDFLTQQLSRNFIIRNDYGLYEYTVYVYK